MRSYLYSAAILTVFPLGQAAAAAKRDAQDVVYLGDKGPVLLRLHVQIDGKPLAEVWETFMGKLFASLDKDGDGVLDKTEAERVPSPVMLFNNGPGFAGVPANIAAAIDKNRDGKITRQELTDWYRRNGASPFQLRVGNNDQLSQLVFVLNGQPQQLSPDALNEKLFALLDTNKDGKLCRAEMAKAPAILRKLDLDDDETVSTQEMSGNATSSVGAEQVAVFAARDNSQQNRSPFIPVAAGESSKMLAQRLLEHYGPKGQKAAPKKLSRQDLGLDEASFAKIDADEDGKLDIEELARFARRDPDVELRIRLGHKTAKEAAVELIASKNRSTKLAKSVRTLADGTLILEMGTTQLELGHGQDAGDPQYAVRLRQQYLAQFRMADKDNNGYLDKSEADKSQAYRNLFRMMDRDGDGKLFEKEIIAHLNQMKQLQEAALHSCASLTVKDQGRGLFDLADTDSDGRLSVREMRQMVKLIEQLDRDGDEQFSREEIPHKYRLDVRLGPANGNLFTPRTVVVSNRMGRREPELPQRSGPLWFQKMDRNHDGDVSRREFLGRDEEFRKIDRDGDGLISGEEARLADDNYRKRREKKP